MDMEDRTKQDLAVSGAKALGRMRGYLQMPQGSRVCSTSGPVDLINTSGSRSASIWELPAQEKCTRRRTFQRLVLQSQFLENRTAGLGSEFVLPSQGADPRSSRIIADAREPGATSFLSGGF